MFKRVMQREEKGGIAHELQPSRSEFKALTDETLFDGSIELARADHYRVTRRSPGELHFGY